MNSSGIYRKVDELGRIVIPVEIRKILNIKEGENLEFNIQKNNIILNKKSLILQNIDFFKGMENAIASTIDGNYIITDREKVILSSNKELIDKDLNDELINLLETYEEYILIKNKIISDKELVVFPYYIDNNVAGFIILYDINDLNKYISLVKFLVNYVRDVLRIF